MIPFVKSSKTGKSKLYFFTDVFLVGKHYIRCTIYVLKNKSNKSIQQNTHEEHRGHVEGSVSRTLIMRGVKVPTLEYMTVSSHMLI